MFANDQMIMDCNAKSSQSCFNLFRHFNIGSRWCRITTRMIVHHNYGTCAKFQRSFCYLTRIERCVIDRASLLNFVLYKRILPIQKQHPELFNWFTAYCNLEVVEKYLPRTNDWSCSHLFS